MGNLQVSVKSLGQSKIKTCEKHGEYSAELFRCPQCDEIIKQEEKQKKKAEAEQSRQLRLNRSGITKRFINSTLEGYKSVNDKAKENLSIINKYFDNFKKVKESGSSLMLCGTPGTGKTHLACAIGISLSDQGFRIKYTTVYKMLAEIKATYSKHSEKLEADVIASFVDTELLIIDEVGVQFGSDAEKILFYQIINGRYDNVLPTILISNLTKNELKNFIGERCFDRLKEGSGAVLSFDWGSYRK